MRAISPDNLYYLGRGRASVVYRDQGTGNAIKVFKPGLLSTVLCWLIDGIGYPYAHNEDALLSAKAKRGVMNGASLFLFGERRFAGAMDAVNVDGRYGLELEYVDGRIPATRDERDSVSEFLSETYHGLRGAGITYSSINPTFLSVNPRRHRGWGDVRLTDKNPVVIDCEPSIPHFITWTELVTFDGVDLRVLEPWYSDNRTAIKNRIGTPDTQKLDGDLEEYRAHAAKWRDSEPTYAMRIEAYRNQRQDDFLGMLHRGIQRYVDDGRIRSEDVQKYFERANVIGEPIKGFLTHLSISLLTPTGVGTLLGMVARPASTVLLRNLTDDDARRQVHSNWVALFSIPPFGVGTFAGYPLATLSRATLSGDWKTVNLYRIILGQYLHEKKNRTQS
ncbi:hypothetical protein A3K63_04820 [Candidatus Micrarchaeota archaeon RBG_16_49_10]|nr:MAG: hypothetical protein A3K63_04820 [Candidatus Micrarchaeota archaeon RBG_16_49_10]